MKSKSGFTIVELLIVIVVIAILAAITIVAYNGIQARANDSRRLSDFESIQKALSLYATDNKAFPVSVPNPGNNTWELSTNTGFLSSLNSYTNSRIFTDPINTGDDTSSAVVSGVSRYQYHTFGAGTNGCPASLGPYYVLFATGMQAQQTGGAVIKTNGCPGQTLFTGSYLTKTSLYCYFGFLNGS